jgi:hypothetical protein
MEVLFFIGNLNELLTMMTNFNGVNRNSSQLQSIFYFAVFK